MLATKKASWNVLVHLPRWIPTYRLEHRMWIVLMGEKDLFLPVRFLNPSKTMGASNWKQTSCYCVCSFYKYAWIALTRKIVKTTDWYCFWLVSAFLLNFHRCCPWWKWLMEVYAVNWKSINISIPMYVLLINKWQ